MLNFLKVLKTSAVISQGSNYIVIYTIINQNERVEREVHKGLMPNTIFYLLLDEEPFLILADQHEIRKISTDGSNYTLLKQV